MASKQTIIIYEMTEKFYAFNTTTSEISKTPHTGYGIIHQAPKKPKKPIIDPFAEDYIDDEYDRYCESLVSDPKSKNHQSSGPKSCYSTLSNFVGEPNRKVVNFPGTKHVNAKVSTMKK
jgi:hypothetical protein